MLLIIGKKDIQVDWEKDGKALEQAAANRSNVSFAYPEDANHLLKHEEKPRQKLNARNVGSHYNSADARIDEEASGSIFRWLDSLVER